MSGEHHINVTQEAIPVVHLPRKVPYLLKEKLKVELDRMERDEIIDKEKPNGKLRICLDPHDLGTQRFHDYIYGKHFTVESDHKPLRPIFSKPIASSPPRIQRFRLKLQKYDMTTQFTPERNLSVADAL